MSEINYFIEYFKVDTTINSNDFVDIPLTTDLPLFVDPFSFKIGDSLFDIMLNNYVVDYFQCIIDSIRADDLSKSRELLNNLREPNETHLGLSSGAPSGRGVGQKQSLALLAKLKESKAVSTGCLRDLADCELLIPGISSDKISDISINVTRHMLADYTTTICKANNIQTKSVPAGVGWSPKDSSWVSKYAELPLYDDRPIILVPKRIVRRSLALDYHYFYDHFIVTYLQQEHLTSNSSLVKVLKGGTRKVTKKSIKQAYPCSKEYIFEFISKHPDVLRNFKNTVAKTSKPISDGDLETICNQLGLAPPQKEKSITVIKEINVQTNIVHGDNIGGSVGSGVVNARDINSFKGYLQQSKLDGDAIQQLTLAREELGRLEISKSEMNDIADDIGKITKELQQPEPDKGMLAKWWRRIKDAAPTVATIIGAIKDVGEIIAGT
jgi:hypothetical protein